jgi:hypothetical protein
VISPLCALAVPALAASIAAPAAMAVNLFMSLLPIPLDAVPRTAAANLTIAPRGSPPHRPPLPP